MGRLIPAGTGVRALQPQVEVDEPTSPRSGRRTLLERPTARSTPESASAVSVDEHAV